MADLIPPVDYTSKDYISFRQMMIDAIADRLPEWTSRSTNDFGIVLVELFSYLGDVLSFYGDRIANEAFLATATQRASVLRIARMLDYRPANPVAASVTIQFTVSAGVGTITIPAGTQVSTSSIEAATATDAPVIFETDEELAIDSGSTTTGSVAATQGETITGERLGVSSGVPDQIFQLQRTPVIEGSPQIFIDEDGDPATATAQWAYIEHLIDATADDPVFTVQVDERGVTYVLFGDDVNGRIPPLGAPIFATYRIGGGERGNVQPNSLVELIDPVTNVVTIINPLAASGGVDAESIDEIRRNAPRSLRTVDRAVTLEDYAELALKASQQVSKAKAAAAVYSNVTIYVAPSGGGVASAALKTLILDYIEDKKMINATVTIGDPTYVGVDVEIDPLAVLPNYRQETVKRAVETAVQELLTLENVDFAARISISEIYQAINSAQGVDYAVVTLLARAGDPPGVDDVETTALEIPQAGTITITATGGIV